MQESFFLDEPLKFQLVSTIHDFSNQSENPPSLKDIIKTWSKERSTPPYIMWYRPLGKTKARKKYWTQTIRLVYYFKKNVVVSKINIEKQNIRNASSIVIGINFILDFKNMGSCSFYLVILELVFTMKPCEYLNKSNPKESKRTSILRSRYINFKGHGKIILHRKKLDIIKSDTIIIITYEFQKMAFMDKLCICLEQTTH